MFSSLFEASCFNTIPFDPELFTSTYKDATDKEVLTSIYVAEILQVVLES